MSAIYERSQVQLDDFVHAMPQCDEQVGAVFSIGGQVVGFDAFDSAETFAKASPKLIRSYAVDAMESAANTAQRHLVDALESRGLLSAPTAASRENCY